MDSVSFETLDDLSAVFAVLPADLQGLCIAVETEGGHDLTVPEDRVAEVRALANDLPAARRARLVSYAAAKRWRVETGGFIWQRPGATTEAYYISTDDRSQGKIDAERKAADEGRRRPGDVWKCGDPATGRVVYAIFTDAEIIDMSNHARDRVCDCFNAEANVTAAIELGAVTTTAEIDAANWP